MAFMRETPTRKTPFSWVGFLSLSLGIGALQMMLDRGQDQGWFDSSEIVIEGMLSVVGFYFFFADAATTTRPFIPLKNVPRLELLHRDHLHVPDRHDPAGTMALVTPYIQNLMGYPVLVERLSARRARHRHVLLDDGGRATARQRRRALADRASG